MHSDVYYLCGETNRRLKHLLLAEQMLLKCLSFEFHSPFTYASLGFLYRDLGNSARACALFKRALDQKAGQSALVAFELAKLIAAQGLVTESLVYFTKAYEISLADPLVRSGEPNSVKQLSEILMHRSCAYEALGLTEMCAKDMRLICQVDPGFRLRYYEEA